MIEEYQYILKNDVWEVVPRHKHKPMVSSKWIFKTKHSVDGSIENFKAIFFTRGFSQKEGIDYEETFAPVARYTSIRTILSLSSKMKWKLHQMDVNTSFLKMSYKRKCILNNLQVLRHMTRKHMCAELRKNYMD